MHERIKGNKSLYTQESFILEILLNIHNIQKFGLAKCTIFFINLEY